MFMAGLGRRAVARVLRAKDLLGGGDEVVDPAISVPQLAADKEKVINDQVSTTRIYRMWPIPGATSSDTVPLALAQTTLGGLASSRLDNALLRGQGLAVSVRSEEHTSELP